MENNTLLGQTTSTGQYDGSGVFNPNTPNADADPNYVPAETNDSTNDATENTESKNNLLMYAGAALLLYFFVFKKK
jgi:hypothetical protein